jgi:hypothetical protein
LEENLSPTRSNGLSIYVESRLSFMQWPTKPSMAMPNVIFSLIEERNYHDAKSIRRDNS